jgi:hypothetical protein
MTKGFKTITEIIKNDEAFEEVRKISKNYNVVEEFSLIFPDLGKVAQAVKVEKKILYLKAENSVWRSELNFRQKVIIDKINNHFNEQIIKSVRFVSK